MNKKEQELLKIKYESELLEGTMSEEKIDMGKELIAGKIDQEGFDTGYGGYDVINKLNVIYEDLEYFKEGSTEYQKLITEANTITNDGGFTDRDDINTFLIGVDKKSEM